MILIKALCAIQRSFALSARNPRSVSDNIASLLNQGGLPSRQSPLFCRSSLSALGHGCRPGRDRRPTGSEIRSPGQATVRRPLRRLSQAGRSRQTDRSLEYSPHGFYRSDAFGRNFSCMASRRRAAHRHVSRWDSPFQNTIEGIVAGVLWKDGSITAGWSNMDVGNLASLILILDEAQRRRTLGEGEI